MTLPELCIRRPVFATVLSLILVLVGLMAFSRLTIRAPFSGRAGFRGVSIGAYVQAGAGIVADSDPEREYYETLKKAEALIKTLEVL